MTYPKNLAELKRFIKVGTVLTMTHHDWYPNGKLIGVPRTVIAVTGSRITLAIDPDARKGSSMYWPKASGLYFTSNGFKVALDDENENFMTYEFGGE